MIVWQLIKFPQEYNGYYKIVATFALESIMDVSKTAIFIIKHI